MRENGEMRTKAVLVLAVLCLMSSVVIVSSDSIAVADESDDDAGITTIQSYASTFVLSDENNVGYAAKWEISFTSDFSSIEESSTDNTYTYTYPYETGHFYVKEYISTSMTYEPERTKSSIVKVEVLGPASVVTLDTMDGNEPTTTSLPYIVGTGSTASLPTPTRDGYVFTGWYYDAACTEKFEPSVTITSDTTLYASWIVSIVSGDVGGSSSSDLTNVAMVVAVVLILILFISLLFLRKRHREEKNE
jgi:uncharacterized repeat protein (TIGR02543 family)